MTIDKISLGLKGLAGYTPIESSKPIKDTNASGTSKASFGELFNNALGEVDHLQKAADDQIQGLTLGRDGVTPHGAMLALEKADVAFQLMSTIRAKIVRVYEEVLRTQI